MTNNHSANSEGEIEVEDNATEEEIQADVEEAIFGSGLIEYGWSDPNE